MNRDVVMLPRIQSDHEDGVQQLVAGGFGICALPAYSAIAWHIVLRPVEELLFHDIVKDCSA